MFWVFDAIHRYVFDPATANWFSHKFFARGGKRTVEFDG